MATAAIERCSPPPEAELLGEGDREAVEGASAATLLVVFVAAQPSKFEAGERLPPPPPFGGPPPPDRCRDLGEERGETFMPARPYAIALPQKGKDLYPMTPCSCSRCTIASAAASGVSAVVSSRISGASGAS